VVGEDGKPKYPVKSVGIMTQHGGSAKDSRLLHGYCFMMARAAQGMPLTVNKARIALLDIDLRKSKMHMGVQVLVSDPSELAKIRQKELDITSDRIKLLLAAGANVILTTKGIDDMALKYFVEAGALACRRVRREDLRRIAKMTGGTLLTTLANMEGEEAVDPSVLGVAEQVVEERVADDDFIVIKGCKQARACSVLLRGANEHMLGEVRGAPCHRPRACACCCCACCCRRCCWC
jgi:T-complex protein 1 subunit alpha